MTELSLRQKFKLVPNYFAVLRSFTKSTSFLYIKRRHWNFYVSFVSLIFNILIEIDSKSNQVLLHLGLVVWATTKVLTNQMLETQFYKKRPLVDAILAGLMGLFQS